MAGQFLSPDGDLETSFVSDTAIIDQFAKTGSLWGWGRNANGSIGDGTTTQRSKPVQVAGINWSSISSSPTYWNGSSSAIKTDGTLWVWGLGDDGRIGDGTIVSKSSPVQITGTNWKQSACGKLHTAAIKTDGTLWLWGRNARNQLGTSNSTNYSSPVQTTSATNDWKMVACGEYSTMAIKTDGTLWGWGFNTYGGIGMGETNATLDKSTPTQVGSNTTWKQVALGAYHGGAVKTDGTLWMWGYNPSYYAAVGDGTGTDRFSPVQTAAGGTNWKQLSCGNNTSACIKTDGTLWTWGNGVYYGCLGDGASVVRNSPVQTISGGTNWRVVSCGNYHMAAIKTDGTLWTWGNNYYGDLGDGTILAQYSGRSSPVQTAAGGTNWKQVACGQNGSLAIHFYDAGDLYPTSA